MERRGGGCGGGRRRDDRRRARAAAVQPGGRPDGVEKMERGKSKGWEGEEKGALCAGESQPFYPPFNRPPPTPAPPPAWPRPGIAPGCAWCVPWTGAGMWRGLRLLGELGLQRRGPPPPRAPHCETRWTRPPPQARLVATTAALMATCSWCGQPRSGRSGWGGRRRGRQGRRKMMMRVWAAPCCRAGTLSRPVRTHWRWPKVSVVWRVWG